MTVIRSLVIVTALGLCGASASASTMEECMAKYKAAVASNRLDGTWAEFQKTKCGINTKATTPLATAPKPQPVERHQ